MRLRPLRLLSLWERAGVRVYRPTRPRKSSTMPPALSNAPSTPATAASAPRAFPKAGDEIAGFRLLSELGRGAFARVFLATEPALGNRPVAVKVSLGGGAEAETLGRLGGHPNIVPVYSAPEDSATGLTAVCMPYLGSATLEDLLELAYSRKKNPERPKKAGVIVSAARRNLQPGDPIPEDLRPDPVCRTARQHLYVVHALSKGQTLWV